MKSIKYSLIAFSLSLFYFVFVAPSCSEVHKSIPQNPSETSPGEYPEADIKSITEEGGFICEVDENSLEALLHLKFDNGDVYICHTKEDRIDSIKLSTGGTVHCKYTNDGDLSECATDYGGFKVIKRCSYSNGFINEIEGITSIKQPNGTFTDETNYKCTDFVVDQQGIQSCVYETFVAGSSFQKMDVVVDCYSQDNNLYQSATHCSLIEFTDYFNSIFYFSPKCIKSISATDQDNNTFDIKYTCTFNSADQLDIIDIDHPSKKTKRTYTYN